MVQVQTKAVKIRMAQSKRSLERFMSIQSANAKLTYYFSIFNKGLINTREMIRPENWNHSVPFCACSVYSAVAERIPVSSLMVFRNRNGSSRTAHREPVEEIRRLKKRYAEEHCHSPGSRASVQLLRSSANIMCNSSDLI